jgi:hypothetical protein
LGQNQKKYDSDRGQYSEREREREREQTYQRASERDSSKLPYGTHSHPLKHELRNDLSFSKSQLHATSDNNKDGSSNNDATCSRSTNGSSGGSSNATG